MKKLIATAMALVAGAALATAEITVGVRGSFGLGLGRTVADDFKDLVTPDADFDEYEALGFDVSVDSDVSVNLGKTLGFGGAAFVKVPIWNALGVQPELGFTYNTIGIDTTIDASVQGSYYGVSVDESYSDDATITVSYTTLDIPVLITYDIAVNDALTVTPMPGPQLSIPLGKAKLGGDGDGDADIDSKVLFGIVLGVNGAFNVGPGAIVADLRYNLGLPALKSEDLEVATPRALAISLGYQMKF